MDKYGDYLFFFSANWLPTVFFLIWIRVTELGEQEVQREHKKTWCLRDWLVSSANS